MSDEQIAVTPPEVLPCPFCGKKTEMRYVHGQYGYTSDQVKIGCGPCGVEFAEKTEDWEPGRGSFSIRKEAEEKLLRRWNARHPGWAENEALRQTIAAKDQTILALETDLVRLRKSLRGAFS
jgi:hypothetical protein